MDTFVNPMEEAINAALGGAIQAALEPLRVEVAKLAAAQSELLSIINEAKAKGGLISRLLG